jgi:hypothetical protein
MSARGIITKFVNAALRDKNLPIDGRMTEKAFLAFGVRKSRKEVWHWLAHEMARQKGQTVTLPTPKKARLDKPGKTRKTASFDFYRSDAWRALRFLALKASNGCCCLCGRSNRQHGVILHVDHIKPRSRYPALALTLSNLQVLCEDCNMGKGNRDDTDWR